MTRMLLQSLKPVLALAAIGAAPVIGGCTSATDRDAYFQSRSAVVSAAQGSGATRVVLWPSSGWNSSAVAAADRGTALDIRPALPMTSRDSTR